LVPGVLYKADDGEIAIILTELAPHDIPGREVVLREALIHDRDARHGSTVAFVDVAAGEQPLADSCEVAGANEVENGRKVS
jgi:hypothetical protein